MAAASRVVATIDRLALEMHRKVTRARWPPRRWRPSMKVGSDENLGLTAYMIVTTASYSDL